MLIQKTSHGMFGLLRFPITFLFMKPKGENFAWACLITLSNRWQKNFFQKGLIFLELENGKNWILLFSQSGRSSNHFEIMLLILSRDRVAHRFKLLH